MVAACLTFVSASVLLAGRHISWPSSSERETSVATKHLHRASTLTSSGLVARRRIPCCLRGRIDSAQAEELLAGLGYTVDSSGEQAHHRRRRRRYANKADENQTPHQQNRADENDDGPIEGGLDPQVKDVSFLDSNDFFVSAEDRLYFERNGHTVTRGLFTEQQLETFRPCILEAFKTEEMEALRQKVSVWFGEETAAGLATVPELRARLKRIAPDEVPFLQVFNMFRKDGPQHEAVKKVVLSPRLSHVASQLLGCDRVRLYQDSTFSKRPGDGPSRWHSDLNMAPLDCNDFITAWIPLAAVPARREGGTPLVFASRSHRDFALNHWQTEDQLRGKNSLEDGTVGEFCGPVLGAKAGGIWCMMDGEMKGFLIEWKDALLQEDLTGRYAKKDHTPLAAGDVTWHHGWTLHSSPGNSRAESRTAIAISYFRDGTRLLSSSAKRAPDPEDHWSYSDWITDVSPGDILDHPAVPLVWDTTSKIGSA